MTDLIVKRYVKALLIDIDIQKITKLTKDLELISSAYSQPKVNEILSSVEVKSIDKINFILSLNENINDNLKNLIKLLGENKRLAILPDIFKELTKQLSIMNNNYKGVIYVNEKLKESDIKLIEKQFSKKFNINLSLEESIGSYDGIKVDIDGLGVEVSFSKDRLRAQMIENILKVI